MELGPRKMEVFSAASDEQMARDERRAPIPCDAT